MGRRVLPLDGLLVEYDSFTFHSDPSDVAADLVKQMLWERAGYRVLRIRERGMDRMLPWDILLKTLSYLRTPRVKRADIASTIASIARVGVHAVASAEVGHRAGQSMTAHPGAPRIVRHGVALSRPSRASDSVRRHSPGETSPRT